MSKIIGQALPGIPWEEKPEGYQMPLWRYSKNPIIGRDGNRISNSVFNSAVVPFGCVPLRQQIHQYGYLCGQKQGRY